MKTKASIIIGVVLILIIIFLSFKLNSSKTETIQLKEDINSMQKRIDKLTFIGNVNEGPPKAEEMMKKLLEKKKADTYLTSAYFRTNNEASPMIGYCISFKDWEGYVDCSTDLNEVLDKKSQDHITRELNRIKITEKLGDLMNKKNLTMNEVIEGLRRS